MDKVFAGHPLVKRSMDSPTMGSAELNKVEEFDELYLDRLCDLSRFMRCLNGSLAIMANEEDGYTGLV